MISKQNKNVADPNDLYTDLSELWRKGRAICGGERHVKAFDGMMDTARFGNLLIPFSPTMSPLQYAFYKAEAELPGITSQFARMIVGGLLRKQPVLKIPKGLPEEAVNWINNEFGQDDSSLVAFLDDALWEEIQTSRAWVYVDFPSVDDINDLAEDERKKLKPYPVLWSAEFVINWHISVNSTGRSILDRVITKGYVEEFKDNEFHPDYYETVWVHELNKQGNYQIRVYRRETPTVQMDIQNNVRAMRHEGVQFQLVETITDILVNDQPLKFIPAWPLNGNIDPVEPTLTPIFDKEISLYNKLSRRNHLLYGAATYTPWIKSDMGDDEFREIVAQGLGTWIRLGKEDDIGALQTPSDSLVDMDRAIVNSIEEMAKLGIRMLTPETAQSGVALQLRNASQTAQLGTLNNKISNTMSQIISFMLMWRYDVEVDPADVEFSLSADFNPIPLGADWLRLATEWYKEGLIPRGIWLMLLKQNDLIPPDYDDEVGKKEITAEMDLLTPKVDEDYARKMLTDE
jgi:hypothetical protein